MDKIKEDRKAFTKRYNEIHSDESELQIIHDLLVEGNILQTIYYASHTRAHKPHLNAIIDLMMVFQ